MFLGKLHSDLLENFSVVTLEGSVECAITVDYNESELLVVLKETRERRGIKLVSAIIQRLIDWSKGLDIVVDLLLGLSVVYQNDTAEDNEAILGGLTVKLQLLLC